MAKQTPPTEYLDASEIQVEIPLEQMVHLEVSLLGLMQMFHEAGVNAVYQRIIQLNPEEDPESALEDAVDLYNELVEGQHEALEESLSEELEDDLDESSEEEGADEEGSLFDEDKGPASSTLH